MILLHVLAALLLVRGGADRLLQRLLPRPIVTEYRGGALPWIETGRWRVAPE